MTHPGDLLQMTNYNNELMIMSMTTTTERKKKSVYSVAWLMQF